MQDSRVSSTNGRALGVRFEETTLAASFATTSFDAMRLLLGWIIRCKTDSIQFFLFEPFLLAR